MGREGAAFRQRRSSNRHLWKCHPRDLREKVIALNGFIGNMDEFPDGSDHHAICLQDAVRQRGLLLMQLASLSARKSRPSYSVVSGSAARRLLLLYAPSSPFAWALHSTFFFVSDRGTHWLDSSPFSYRLSATNYSRANCDWGFPCCDSRAAGVVLCRSAQCGMNRPLTFSGFRAAGFG